MQYSDLIKEKYTFDDLVKIMDVLTSEDGCPWDRVQTHESIRKNMIEECYEAVEGIDRHSPALLKEELGDILLQVLFHSEISKKDHEFDIDEVVDGLGKKLIFRHPHIFVNAGSAENSEAAHDSWEQMKKKEKGEESLYDTLDRVARTLPSLVRSQKILKKSAKAGAPIVEGKNCKKEELIARYLQLCADANASSLDLEELAYKENEKIIEKVKNTDEN